MSVVAEMILTAARERERARLCGKEARADLYQRASAEAFAALQQAALDAIETSRLVTGAIEMLESSTTIDPDERTSIIARLQQIPAAREVRAEQSHTE